MEDADQKVPVAATPASEWKVEESELQTLPSGNVVRLKRPQLSGMIRRGEIPNPLLQAAGAMEAGQLPDDMAQAVELTDLLVSLAFVEPTIALEDPADGDLPIDKLTDADKGFVAAWIKRDVAAMARFRGERPGADRGEGSGAVRDAA
jgi:hypothetical protein